MDILIYYATNRKHEGDDRWAPAGYGTKFSDDGVENLRFGRVRLRADDAAVAKALKDSAAGGPGDGEALAGILSASAADPARIVIEPYREEADRTKTDVAQPPQAFGSFGFFSDLKAFMVKGGDTLTYIHGYNVSWTDAVGSAAALQLMLNRPAPKGVKRRPVSVILFTWPSDGKAIPWISYKSDRTEAQNSGFAVGRGFLKLRDFLLKTEDPCRGRLHLLCHSMGNYVLQCALDRLRAFTAGSAFPRVFDRIVLAAPDVDDNVLEPAMPMGDLHELGRSVSVYYNRGDVPLHGSDLTKGNPERLGTNGASRPSLVHTKVEQVDCSDVVDGFMEHSYYLSGLPNRDIQLNLAGVAPAAKARPRRRGDGPGSVWTIGG